MATIQSGLSVFSRRIHEKFFLAFSQLPATVAELAGSNMLNLLHRRTNQLSAQERSKAIRLLDEDNELKALDIVEAEGARYDLTSDPSGRAVLVMPNKVFDVVAKQLNDQKIAFDVIQVRSMSTLPADVRRRVRH